MSSVSHALLVRSIEPYVADVSAWLSDEVIELTYEKLGIADVRDVTRRAQRRPLEAAIQSLVVRTESITHESQNALLKILEEPPTSTRILLVVSADCLLLPTVLSRVQVVELSDTAEVAAFEQFLQADYAGRLALIDDAHKRKDTGWQRAMKRGVVHYLRTQSSVNATVEYVSRWLLVRGASNKMLLEQLALTLPVRN